MPSSNYSQRARVCRNLVLHCFTFNNMLQSRIAFIFLSQSPIAFIHTFNCFGCQFRHTNISWKRWVRSIALFPVSHCTWNVHNLWLCNKCIWPIFMPTICFVGFSIFRWFFMFACIDIFSVSLLLRKVFVAFFSTLQNTKFSL